MQRVFGDGRTNYTFRHRGLRFVVLDNSGAPASNGTDVGHPTPEAYVMGNADERTVDMPLRHRL